MVSGMILGMPLPAHLDQLNADQLRCLLIESQARIDKLTYELAYYKRQRYGVKAEHLSPEQAHLFEETADADLAAMTEELEQLSFSPAKEKAQAKRKPLPAELPRTEIHHEPDSTTCTCGCQMKRIGVLGVAEMADRAVADHGVGLGAGVLLRALAAVAAVGAAGFAFVVAPVIGPAVSLMLAIRRCRRPAELERQQDEHEDEEPAAHGGKKYIDGVCRAFRQWPCELQARRTV